MVEEKFALPRPSTTPILNGSVKPGFAKPRSSTFPISASSDVASGSSNSHDGHHNRSQPIDGLPTRNSMHTLHETQTATTIDPLSQHILQRTNTHKSIPLKLLGRPLEAEGSKNPPSEQGASRADAALNLNFPKEKRKGVSFLSRIIGSKKKDHLSEPEDENSEDHSRMPLDTSHNLGFMPRHAAPPRYMRTKAYYKKEKTFNHVFLAQKLEGAGPQTKISERRISSSTNNSTGEGTGKAIWSLAFSKDGKYLAAAGQDRKVRVWAVITTPEEREEEIKEIDDALQDEHEAPRLFAPVFQSKPVQVYEGHSGSVLDLSWSKNKFLLSSSMDKTVRLWHASRSECLCCFQHSDFVTSIQFHPRDDRFFLAGSLDTKLRLWSIPDKSVAFVNSLPDMVTAVAFTPDGRYAIAGCLNGILNIYDTEGLKLAGQIQVRSARGRNSKGSKITGIETMMVPQDDPDGEIKLLVTSNDSRIRLYNFRDRTLEAKFRGNENTTSQIRASFTDDGMHVICGSEDRRAYVWPITQTIPNSDKRAMEVFETQSSIVTVAITAPTHTKQVLALSEDPIYDICNPLPIALMSPEEAAGTPKASPTIETKPKGMPPPQKSQHKRSASARMSVVSKMANESPTYLSRSSHPDGNIIVIADFLGNIKVLRQDCAYQKRRSENWDANSIISRTFLRRSNSAHRSIASSTKTPSERIISWRNSVVRGRASTDGSRSGLRTRSPSPQQPRSANFRLTSSRPPSLDPTETPSIMTTSPPPSSHRPNIDNALRSGEELQRQISPAIESSTDMLNSGKAKDNPLWITGDHSYAYWSKIGHDALAAKSRKNDNDLLSPDRIPSNDRRCSVATSILSSDAGSSKTEREEDILKCDYCRGKNFRGIKDRSGKQKLICVSCNRSVS
ncbi:hypothetical protein N7495_005161 [Penicillium taxi]|uniref:uncharacterized protein n=1 Tax=Penicillium taxi TaxID=168475 RepID=UPI0025456C20|nr:uncharacterized protein N7495_005161 [Penicillium taxi]KAJ5893470.1 hypothetical protein N7495_005161 [Penicillium taxi]